MLCQQYPSSIPKYIGGGENNHTSLPTATSFHLKSDILRYSITLQLHGVYIMLPTRLLAYAIGLTFGWGTAWKVWNWSFRSDLRFIQAPMLPVESLCKVS